MLLAVYAKEKTFGWVCPFQRWFRGLSYQTRLSRGLSMQGKWARAENIQTFYCRPNMWPSSQSWRDLDPSGLAAITFDSWSMVMKECAEIPRADLMGLKNLTETPVQCFHCFSLVRWPFIPNDEILHDKSLSAGSVASLQYLPLIN